MLGWMGRLRGNERRALGAAFGGYAVDAFDYMVYPLLIPTLASAWRMSDTDAGIIATSALVASAVGGWIAGVLADRWGRVRVLQLTIAVFSVFTFASGLTRSFPQLLLTRTLQGLGFGGEWAVGSVLVAETIRPEHRGRAVGLVQSAWAIGWGLAALAYTAIYAVAPEWLAWRMLFWLGLAPAALIVFVRRHVQEPAIHHDERRSQATAGARARGLGFLDIFSRPFRRATLLASLAATGMQGGYYAVTTWLPTFLARERHLSVFGTGGYLAVIISGSFAGYLTAAHLSDRLGRRACFVLFAATAAALVTLYTRLPITNTAMLLLGFPLGFFVSGIFSGMGAFLAELYPRDIRGSGQGFCYNFGRGVGSTFAALVGYASAAIGLRVAMGGVGAAAYLLVIVAVLLLPETRGRELAA
jgi:MFS family permease